MASHAAQPHVTTGFELARLLPQSLSFAYFEENASPAVWILNRHLKVEDFLPLETRCQSVQTLTVMNGCESTGGPGVNLRHISAQRDLEIRMAGFLMLREVQFQRVAALCPHLKSMTIVLFPTSVGLFERFLLWPSHELRIILALRPGETPWHAHGIPNTVIGPLTIHKRPRLSLQNFEVRFAGFEETLPVEVLDNFPAGFSRNMEVSYHALFVRHFFNLRRLKLWFLEDGNQVLIRLSQFQFLEVLALEFQSEEAFQPYHGFPPDAFPVLRSLKLRSDRSPHHPYHTSLLLHISSTNLQRFSFTAPSMANVENIVNLINARWRNVFQSFAMFLPVGPYQPDRLLMRCLSGLLDCRRLCELDIVSHACNGVTNEDLTRMAVSWPGMIKLRLSTRPVYASIPENPDEPAGTQVTLRGLETIIHGMPLLTYLACTVNLVSLSILTVEENFRRHPRLQVLDLERSTTNNVMEAAGTIRRLFPGLHTMKAHIDFAPHFLRAFPQGTIIAYNPGGLGQFEYNPRGNHHT